MLRWLQFGDLHACEGDDWESLGRFRQLVDEANRDFSDRIDFAVLPGDNANHATPEQFRRVAETGRQLQAPLHVLPGDHDFEAGHLDDFRALLAPESLPRAQMHGDTRVVFLDIVSAGSGGPDFRLGREQTAWLRRTLADTAAARRTVVFMHAFPGDLREGGDEVAALFASGGVAYVGTGHTHYNDLLNDGHVVYGATRSTGEIEEGAPGFSVSALDGDVLSWRFREMGHHGPFVLVTSPCDTRLVTDPQSRSQVPDGAIEVRAEVFAAGEAPSVTARLGDGRGIELSRGDEGTWHGRLDGVPDGLHRLTVTARSAAGETDSDTVDVLLRGARERPKRGAAIALGRDVHSVRNWPGKGIPGGRLGPNANGRKW
ncbi:metallophosphoesterase [Aureimonas sp. AU4]|uniref:metallophosphoesterase family protein n=1 Tax=Aureimonas sp. AU4 TaxID=1638163 RepID=UPI000783D8BD|nr:metallophosphoesterase [Aureimonas sp. AU4]